ncbi:MAG TPA: RNA pseudouridine synthase, partial [Pirellulaceae bacterium]|nr:RNA pseudouridine synthase [Pirellulaceae bacterium]
WAVVADRPKPASGELRDWLVKDERLKKVVVTRRGMTDAKEAVLTYQTKGPVPGGTWLEIELQTGRKHQIRVQLAQRGWHILGDQKYGSKASFPHGIALHARTLKFDHPVKHEPLEFTAALPKSWRAFQIEEFEKPAT